MSEIVSAALHNEVSRFLLDCLLQTVGQIILTFVIVDLSWRAKNQWCEGRKAQQQQQQPIEN